MNTIISYFKDALLDTIGYTVAIVFAVVQFLVCHPVGLAITGLSLYHIWSK